MVPKKTMNPGNSNENISGSVTRREFIVGTAATGIDMDFASPPPLLKS